MEDKQIVDLFWARSESAISETDKKYRRYCHSIAYNILNSREDSDECVNDAYIRAWNTIPPQKPERLSAFLGKITRNLALDRYKAMNRQKRRDQKTAVVIDELAECIPSLVYPSDITDDILLRDTLNSFLHSLPRQTMRIFLQRYWYMASVKEIAQENGISQSNVKITLHRTRNRLKEFLEKEGINI